MKSTTEIIATARTIGNSEYLQLVEKSIPTRSNDKMPENGGVPIVLTASMIEMSNFNFRLARRTERGYTRYYHSSR